MQVLDERKARGIADTVGRDASPVCDSRDKHTRGAELLEKLSGAPADAHKAGYAAFAPIVDWYLNEHLFCDIFERDLLTWQERELAPCRCCGRTPPSACARGSRKASSAR